MRASPKRAYMFRTTHATAARPIKTWSGKTPQSLTETWVGVRKARCQLMCALANPNQAQQVGDGPSGCPGRASGRSCGVDEMVGPLPPAWGSCAAGLQPGPQQHPPAGHGGILAAKNFFCLLGGALARRVDQRTLAAPDELPHTSLIS